MAMVQLNGAQFWSPAFNLFGSGLTAASSDYLLDATQEELQCIGTIMIEGGGSKTFGTSSSIGWLTGATITFGAVATLTVGLKHTARISTTTGPPARASVGAGTFDMSCALVGGTNTITANAWRTDVMTTGTPLTVTNGDVLAACFYLGITSGTQAIRLAHVATGSNANLPVITLVTSAGATFTAQASNPNIVFTFNDGTLGWLEPSRIYSVVEAYSIVGGTGGDIQANIFQLPFACEVDALATYLRTSSATSDFSLNLYGTPLGTPTLLASVAGQSNVTATTNNSRNYVVTLPTPVALDANTDYAVGLRQTTSESVGSTQYEVADASHLRTEGFTGLCYGAKSTGGAAFVADSSGRRRYRLSVRVSAVDDGAGAALLSVSQQPGHVYTQAPMRAALF